MNGSERSSNPKVSMVFYCSTSPKEVQELWGYALIFDDSGNRSLGQPHGISRCVSSERGP